MDIPNIPDLTLIRRIGAGSYGDVWIARTLTGVYRAVKIVDRARFPDDRPFQRELDGISRFQRTVGHQPRQLALMHVARLEPQGLLYYVMELADDVHSGTDINPDTYEPLTLKSLRTREPVLPAAECVRLGIELARGLQGLHAAGLIHRDVKPSNIIIVGGLPKLADIGLVSSLEASVTSLGTPGYSPPEGSGSQSADLYGLGRILYELVTGQTTGDFPRLPPDFDRRDDAKTLLELNEVVMRACEPDPKERYGSAQEMLDDLLLIQAGRSVKAMNRMRERLRWLARAAAVAAVIALLAIGALGVKSYLAVRELAEQEAEARRQAERDERVARYSANLGIARLAFQSGDWGLVRNTLRREIPQQEEPDVRGFEWFALWNETAGDAERIFGDVGEPGIRTTLRSPDRQSLVVVRNDALRTTELVNLADGSRRPLGSGVERLAGFTAGGTQVLVLTTDHVVRTIDLASGQPGAAIVENVQILSYLEDDRRILVGRWEPAGGRVWLWDMVAQTELAAWEPTADLAGFALSFAGVSPQGRWLELQFSRTTTAGEREFILDVWDLTSVARQFRRTDLGDMRTSASSPDLRFLAVTTPGFPVRLLEMTGGRTVREFEGFTGIINELTFSSDGTRLVGACADQALRVWDVTQGTLLETLRGHEGALSQAAVVDDQAGIVSASDDGTLRLWRLGVPRRVSVAGGFSTRGPGATAVSPDGTFLARTMADGRVSRVDLNTLQPVGPRWDAAVPLGPAPEGWRALNANRELVVVNPETGSARPTGLRVEGEGQVYRTTASADADVVLLGMSDGTVTLWDAAAAQVLVHQKIHGTGIQAAAVSRDGTWAATGDGTGEIVLWRPRERRSEKQLPAGGGYIHTLAFSPDARRLFVHRADGFMSILDPATLKVETRQPAHAAGSRAAVFSHDGSRLFTGGSDSLILAWSVPDFRVVAVMSYDAETPGLNRGINELLVTAADHELLAKTADGRLQRWDGRRP